MSPRGRREGDEKARLRCSVVTKEAFTWLLAASLSPFPPLILQLPSKCRDCGWGSRVERRVDGRCQSLLEMGTGRNLEPLFLQEVKRQIDWALWAGATQGRPIDIHEPRRKRASSMPSPSRAKLGTVLQMRGRSGCSDCACVRRLPLSEIALMQCIKLPAMSSNRSILPDCWFR